MTAIGVFAIGGSAGGLTALRKILRGLTADFPAAICVTLHLSPDSPGLIPELLAAAGPLPANHAADGEAITGGRIFVAPPDRHFLILRDGRVRLGVGPKENLFRPAIDPLFRSVAAAFGARAAGVLLSGGLDDGVAGLAEIKRAGGTAMVQDPKEADTPSMPSAALRKVEIDHCLIAENLARCLQSLASTPQILPEMEHAMARSNEIEVRIADGKAAIGEIQTLGQPSMFACPECHGVLLEMTEGPKRFRCHTGHAYSVETLATALLERADEAMWSALRALQESEMILRALAASAGAEHANEAAKIVELAGQLRRLIDKRE